MFGRATITLGIGPHSSYNLNYLLRTVDQARSADMEASIKYLQVPSFIDK